MATIISNNLLPFCFWEVDIVDNDAYSKLQTEANANTNVKEVFHFPC
jgi:hypothetical protein